MTATIFALSSAPGRAGVAVIRVSGDRARDAVEALTGRAPPAPRQVVLARLRDGAGVLIDQGLCLWFGAPASFTGEDVCEFQIHGGRAVIGALLGALGQIEGLRPARPGEFTRRAVEHGKFDLTAAEALGDLIAAETEQQRVLALRQQEGGLGELYERWRRQLTRALAWAEAVIDFGEDEVPESVWTKVVGDVRVLANEMQQHLDDGQRGELIRDGLTIAIVGPPNAGKSSLINILTKRDVAIVAPTAGTTRDLIEVRLDLSGYAVTLVDTAGLREAGEEIEAEGIRRSLARARSADLRLLLLDASAPQTSDLVPLEVRSTADIVVWNKIDLARAPEAGGLAISARTGEGVLDIMETLAERVRERLEFPSEAPVLTRARHRNAVEEAVTALKRALLVPEGAPELMAEDLRLAGRALGQITGAVDVEELLDVIFKDFCIGK
ncbi:MAG: tRNA uridine-5-carboxymethylaminomethyl(34) synthesis GTPase MnmE [Rhizomicrobium sp.]